MSLMSFDYIAKDCFAPREEKFVTAAFAPLNNRVQHLEHDSGAHRRRERVIYLVLFNSLW